MLVRDPAAIADLLACPNCRTPLVARGDAYACPACSLGTFPTADGRPVLVDFTRSVLDRDRTLATRAQSNVGRDRWRKLLARVVDGRNPVSPHYAAETIRLLEESSADRPLLLVIGGGEVGSGADALYRSARVGVVAFDIYASPHVTFVADGHRIPLADGSVDAVWVQAVLEHTAEPFAIADEIRRVLKPAGLLYANTAFLWPVCEQAYDFLRFTASGLRWMFRDFEVIAAGSSSGPGTAAVLAIRYLLQSLTRSTKAGQLLALPFVPLRLLDRFCDARRGLDASPALFFFGRRGPEPITLPDLIRYYDEQVPLERENQRHRS
jgi:SAM-dependent methyltransferase